MKKSKILVAGIVTALPSLAYAFPMQVSHDAIARAVAKQVKKAKLRDSATCPNFTGSWLGTCQEQGQAPQAASTVVAQSGCSVIVTDSQTTEIGGFEGADASFLATDTSTGQPLAVAASSWTSANWSTDGSTLILQETLDARAIGAGGAFVDILSGAVALNSTGQLVVEVADTAGLFAPIMCTYSLQQ